MEPGFSRTVHYEISGAGRIDYQYHDSYAGGDHGDPHPVVFSEPSTCPAIEPGGVESLLGTAPPLPLGDDHGKCAAAADR